MSVADKIDVARMSFAGSNVAKAVCKATTREVMGPKKKHVDYLLQCTDNELMNLAYMIENLLERCRMSSWVIVSKALVTFHSLMSNGNERFFQQVSAKTALWDLENFLDKTAVIGYDMSSFIKRYSKYLTQKVQSYRQMNYDFCRAKRGADGVLRTLSTDKLLKALVEIQAHIDSLLEVDLQSSEFSNGVINSAFVLLFKDMIKLFACYNDGMINLLEKYYEMNKESCKESLEIYKKFLVRTDQVSKFLTVAQDIGVSEDAIPDLAKAPSSLLESLENHYKSLEKGQVPMASQTKHLNLAPITIPLKSEEFNFKEDLAEQFSPEENNNEEIDGLHPTLLQSAQTTNPGGEGPWQTMFEPEVQQPPQAAEPSKKQDDLLELHAVFQAQQAPPMNAFQQPGANFGAPMASNVGSIYPPTTINYPPTTTNYPPTTTNPFDSHSELQSSGNILQPMNKPQPAPQEVQPQRQSSTGDLHSSLSKVAKSLDNFDLASAALGTGSSSYQWTVQKPKVKTGGANFQIGTTAGTTLPTGNPISPTLPYNAPQSTIPPAGLGMGQLNRPPTAMGMGQPQQILRPGYTQPQMGGVRPTMGYGQEAMMQPQSAMFGAPPRPNTNPFGNPVPRNQAMF